jgi:DNA-binding LacI/PurR family transcriptional regulator
MVTMKDVAVAAGVSAASVSNAYNRPGKLSGSQRAHILRVAQRLGYTGPHPGASSLRTGTVGAFGLLITDWLYYAFEDPATVQLLRGIAQVSEMADVALTLLPVGGKLPELAAVHGGEEHGVVRDWPAVRRSVVDGFLVYSLPDNHPAITTVLNRKAPVVIIDSPRVEGVSFVGIDDRRAAREAAMHLLDLGHQNIGVLVDRLLPDGNVGFVSQARLKRTLDAVARERLAGVNDALKTAGSSLARIPIVEAGGFLTADARPAVETLLAKHAVTAILATTDVLALAALEILSERGLDVPGDISVIGFDDLPAAGPAGLTTVAQPLVDKGRIAAETILQAMDGQTVGSIILPTRLEVRATTAAPPRAARVVS